MYTIHSKSDRQIKWRDFTILVKQGVFHPGFLFSTNTLADYLLKLELKDKNALELGCGTGALSCLMAREGANVWASDINPLAVGNATANAELNDLSINCVVSDLFLELNNQRFDYIVINPPYYPKAPIDMSENAWFCGEEFEYFHKLFIEIQPRLGKGAVALMVLSEDCQIGAIEQVANRRQIELSQLCKDRSWLEKNYVFELSPQHV